jgi:hypothetical protein
MHLSYSVVVSKPRRKISFRKKFRLIYYETAGLTYDEVIDSNRMSTHSEYSKNSFVMLIKLKVVWSHVDGERLSAVWPYEFWIAQNVAQHIFAKINTELLAWATMYCNLQKTAQSNHSLSGRKFAQSGHLIASISCQMKPLCVHHRNLRAT